MADTGQETLTGEEEEEEGYGKTLDELEAACKEVRTLRLRHAEKIIELSDCIAELECANKVLRVRLLASCAANNGDDPTREDKVDSLVSTIKTLTREKS